MSGKAAPRGDITRPRSGSNKRQRNITKLVRLNESESAAVEEAASRAGLTFASYARTQMLGRPVPDSVKRPPVEKELLAKSLGQLGKVGSNLNQIAHAANIGETVCTEINQVLDEVRQLAAQIKTALGRKP